MEEQKEEKKANQLGTMHIGGECAVYHINADIYPLQAVFHAAYMMIDKAFIVIDGNPTEEILVEIRKREEKQELKELLNEFNDELLKYSVYEYQSRKTKKVRDAIVERALLTNFPDMLERGAKVRLNRPKKVQTDGIPDKW